jgi:DNA-binding MarR family transcriptional regulator
MKLDELATTLKKLKTTHDLDGIDLILINEVDKLGSDAFVMRVLKGFDLCSQATTHTRIKKLIKKEMLTTELDGANMRTKRLVLTDKTKEILYGVSK